MTNATMSAAPTRAARTVDAVTRGVTRVPHLMRAAVFDRPGAADVLVVREVATPTPRPDEVLVRVHAAALNPKDAIFRERAAGGRASFPRGTGFDLAGEVVATGAQVGDLAPGTRVWGFLDGVIGGTAAEYVAVKRAWIARMPDGLEWGEAAALPLVASAALQALRDVARLRAGERVLIKGASGGVGSAALQVAKACGAHVTAQVTAHVGAEARDAAVAHVRALGADDVTDDPADAIARSGRRFDVFLDCAGGSGYLAHRRLLARGARWVTVAPNLVVFALAPLSALVTRLAGGPRLGFVIVRPRSDDLEAIADLVGRGALRMPLAAEFPLDAIVAAHRALSRRGVPGKRVVRVIPSGGRP